MPSSSLTVTDNRTGKSYELPIDHGTIKALDLRQVKTGPEDFGLMSYDPAFTNTASCRSAITFIDGDRGILEYRGYPIEAIAEQASFLEVAYLLGEGELPTTEQLSRWVDDVKYHTYVHTSMLKFLEGFRYDAHPMGMLVSSVAALSTFYPDAKNVQDPWSRYVQRVRLMAKLPTIAAFAFRASRGLPFVFPDNDLDYIGNFVNMTFALGGRHKANPVLQRALEILLILHADHEQNCSTNAVRSVASSGVDVFSAISSGVAALYGPLHGGANEAVLRMLDEIGSKDRIPGFIERVKRGEGRLMGFGHRVYKSYDPRAKLVKKVADGVFEQTGMNPKLDIALELERIALQDDYFVSRKLYPNVDFYSGLIYQAMGYPTDYFTVLFARVAGAVGGNGEGPRAEDRPPAAGVHRPGATRLRAARAAGPKRMIRRLAAGCAVLLLAIPAPARAQAARRSPTLVVHLTIDQMRADYLERFFPQLTGGLGRLMRGGAWFTDAYQDHAMSETAPGHATVLSGRNPTSTGIVRNSEGVTDSTPQGALLEQLVPGASPSRFRGTALFDWMHARWTAARALSVSRKDRGAILPIGRAKQNVYWYQGGEFTTSRYYRDSLPAWVRAFNVSLARALTPGRRWDLLLDPSAYPEPDSMDYEHLGRDFVFPHLLPDDSAALATAIIATPWMDSLTLAFALEGLQRLRLGTGNHPDLLAISLSATDYVGHAYGPDSREVHDQVLRLDRWLGVFLDSLARLRDTSRVIISLTADHGVTSFPEYWNRRGDFHAQWVSFAGLARADSIALAARAGPGSWIRYFETGLLVMDRAGLAAHGVNVDSVVRAIADEVRAYPQVLRVDTPHSLAARDTATDAIARRWRNLVPPDLPAELFVSLKPHMSWAAGNYAQHGQPSDDDTHVPLILYGPAYRAGTYGGRVSVADIAPTIARVLGIRPAERVQGRVLREALR